MKKIKIVITLIIFSISINTNAQFFKKLKEKAKQKVEREAEKRAQRRVDKKIDKTFDEAENEIDDAGTKKKSNKNTTATISRKKFEFSHVYKLELTSKKKVTELEYYLKNDVNYLVMNFPNVNTKMITIVDLDEGKAIMLMENGNKKTQMTTNFDFNSAVEEANKDITVKKTGATKQLLGYTCYEYKVTGKDFNSTAWIAEDLGISFPKNFQGSSKKSKKQNNSWMYNLDGLMMEMTMIDTSKRKPNTITMVCTKLEKKSTTIDASIYKNMF